MNNPTQNRVLGVVVSIFLLGIFSLTIPVAAQGESLQVKPGVRFLLVREAPVDGEAFHRVFSGTILTIFEYNEDRSWARVQTEKGFGWVAVDYLEPVGRPDFVVTPEDVGYASLAEPYLVYVQDDIGYLLVRSQPSTNGVILNRIYQGTPITVLGKNYANWLYVSVPGWFEGWVAEWMTESVDVRFSRLYGDAYTAG